MPQLVWLDRQHAHGLLTIPANGLVSDALNIPSGYDVTIVAFFGDNPLDANALIEVDLGIELPETVTADRKNPWRAYQSVETIASGPIHASNTAITLRRLWARAIRLVAPVADPTDTVYLVRVDSAN